MNTNWRNLLAYRYLAQSARWPIGYTALNKEQLRDTLLRDYIAQQTHIDIHNLLLCPFNAEEQREFALHALGTHPASNIAPNWPRASIGTGQECFAGKVGGRELKAMGLEISGNPLTGEVYIHRVVIGENPYLGYYDGEYVRHHGEGSWASLALQVLAFQPDNVEQERIKKDLASAISKMVSEQISLVKAQELPMQDGFKAYRIPCYWEKAEVRCYYGCPSRYEVWATSSLESKQESHCVVAYEESLSTGTTITQWNDIAYLAAFAVLRMKQ